MGYRIYLDESGTHDSSWFIIGALFVPDHGPLHSALCQAKEDFGYLNHSPRYNARYRELHLASFRSRPDLDVGERWIDIFMRHNCYFRCVVVDWGIWDGGFFGNAFEPEALKKRRAYKKWAEMLLHPEVKSPSGGERFYHGKLYLDRLRILAGYDVLDHLRSRFVGSYQGCAPFIEEFQHTDSWRDANQCLQLCDLLTGCQYQALVPSSKDVKLRMRDALAVRLRHVGVESLEAGYWRGFSPKTLNQRFPKFSAWFWRPDSQTAKKNRKKRRMW